MTVIASRKKPPAETPPAPAALASMGHNRPPLDAEATSAFMDSIGQREGFSQRVADLLDAAPRAYATDADSAAKCTEFVKQLSAVEKVIEEAHRTAKEPYLRAGRAVDAAKTVMLQPVSDAKREVNGKLTTYLREEDERRRAEQRRMQAEAEARRREAEAAAVSAEVQRPVEPMPVAEAAPVQVRSDFGAVASGRRVWRHEIVDLEIAFIAVADNERVREAIDKAIGGLVRNGSRNIAGVRVFEDVVASVR